MEELDNMIFYKHKRCISHGKWSNFPCWTGGGVGKQGGGVVLVGFFNYY